MFISFLTRSFQGQNLESDEKYQCKKYDRDYLYIIEFRYSFNKALKMTLGTGVRSLDLGGESTDEIVSHIQPVHNCSYPEGSEVNLWVFKGMDIVYM